MKRNLMVIVGSFCVFLSVFAYGLFLAVHKTVGNDEIYSLVASVTPLSYLEIFRGSIGGEGNIAPLFYLIQKLILDVAHYQIPPIWTQGSQFWPHWYHSDISSQIILRINPVLFMSLAVTSIFYYFARFHSPPFGLYSVFVFFSAPMVWGYWADARHYSLWIFLTTVQSLLFLALVGASPQAEPSKSLWRVLIGVHLLMSMTIIFSLTQIIIVSFLLWAFVERKLQRYIALTVWPACVCLFYYFKTVKYAFWVEKDSWQLVVSCFTQEQILILVVFTLFAGATRLSKISEKFKDLLGGMKTDQDKIGQLGRDCLSLCVLMILAAFIILGVFEWGNTHGAIGNKISARYFIFLTPLGIISTTLFSYIIFTAYKGRLWAQVNILICLAGILVLAYLNNYPFWVNINIVRSFLRL